MAITITSKVFRVTPDKIALHLWKQGALQPENLVYTSAQVVRIESDNGWVVNEVTAALPDGSTGVYVALAVRPGPPIHLPSKIGVLQIEQPPKRKD